MRAKIDKRELKRMASEGLSAGQIARHFGCTAQGVNVALRRLKVRYAHTRPGPRPGTPKSAEAIASLRMVGRIRAAKLGWPQAETVVQARVLAALHGRGPCPVAVALGRRPSARERVALRRLEAMGLVVRRRVRGRLMACRLAPGVARQDNTAPESACHEHTFREPGRRGRRVAG